MNKDNLSEDTFSYKDFHKFNENNYVLVVKDEEYPNSSLLSILYVNNNKVLDIDEYEMGDKILATKNNQMLDVVPLSDRFSLQQLIKISTGTIIGNDKYYEGSTFPKSLTFHTNVHELRENEIIEIFEGTIDEPNSMFYLKEQALKPLLEDVYLLQKNSFFVLQKEILSGPFIIKNTDVSGNIIIEKSLWKVFGIYELTESNHIEFTANEIKRRIIITSVNEFKLLEALDFISNTELLDKFESSFRENPELYSATELKNFLDTMKKLSTEVVFKNPNLQNRLAELLVNSESQILKNINISNILPEIEQVKNEIDNLEKDKLEVNNQLEAISNDLSKQLTTYEHLLVQIETVKNEIDNLDKVKEEQLKGKKIELEYEIKDLEDKKSKIDFEIEEEKSSKQQKLSELEANIKYMEGRESSLRSGIETLQKEFTDEQKFAHNKLQELLVQNQHYNILSGRDFSTLNKSKKINFITYKEVEISKTNNLDKLKRYNLLKSQVIGILEQNNRKLPPHFIDNLLIAIHQNTLTLFAGLPGTGKTSLVRLLINILSPKERVKEIAVGRGWTSQKDLIGFYNPLSKKFHSSSTNLYDLLKQLDWERSEGKYLNAPMAYVLLDEANLSPLEHYWSTFYNLTDSYATENEGLKIELGDSEIVEYYNNLRFIGTINYDQTTEELSPRVIDRTNIIRMDNLKSFDISKISNTSINSLNISFKECIEIFDLMDFKEEQNVALDEEFDRKLNEIKRKFDDLKIFISPRVQIAIKQYCKIAKLVMPEQNKPLDYCIAQRLLPLIRTQGNNAKLKLQELKKIFDENKYEISSKILNDILLCGSEGEIFQDSFNYFLTLSNV